MKKQSAFRKKRGVQTCQFAPMRNYAAALALNGRGRTSRRYITSSVAITKSAGSFSPYQPIVRAPPIHPSARAPPMPNKIVTIIPP